MGFLKEQNKNGKTILLTTHYIEEAEKLCDQIAIINEGNIIANGKTEDLISSMGKNHITIETNLDDNTDIEDFKWKYSINKNKLVIETNNPDSDIIEIIEFMKQKSIPINKIRSEQSTLEEIFINLTNKNE